MPRKQPPSQPNSAIADPASKTESSASKISELPITPATMRFRISAGLFCAWLAFLVYLAFLTWSGK